MQDLGAITPAAQGGAVAFVLAAGLGTRLRPLTLHRPKPLVPVCGVPLLAYSLALCAQHGLREVIVNAHWLAGQLEAWAGEREGCRVRVVTEGPEILGTGGGLRNVAERLAERFAVLNGDVLHDVDLAALLAAVPEGGGAMALRRSEDAARYGIVAGDATGRVVRLREIAKAPPEGPVDETTHFTGIHALHRDSLERVPEGFACVVRTAYRDLVPERRVAALPYSGPWLDAGDPAAYLDANLQVLERRVCLALDPLPRAAFAVDGRGARSGEPLPGVNVDGPAWIGPGAQIGAGATLRRAIVGAGARVPAGAVLEDAVVWDGVDAPARLVGAIAYDGGVLTV